MNGVNHTDNKQHSFKLTANGHLVLPKIWSCWLRARTLLKGGMLWQMWALTAMPMSSAVPGSKAHAASWVLELAKWLMARGYGPVPVDDAC